MANNVDSDQTAENGKQCRPWKYSLEKSQTMKTLLKLLRMANSIDLDNTTWKIMANSVDPDQNAENGKQCRSW